MPLNCADYASHALFGEVDLPSRYLDINYIGRGATCVVLKAHDSFLDRNVAIKVLRSELSDYTSVRRFQQEAKMMSSFSLKHLPVVLDFGLSPSNRPYMVMELLEGTSLKETISESRRLNVELSIEITIQILLALQHAHERNIVHRDLKTQNIMVTWGENGEPLIKVVDFGLASEISRPSAITECGAALGTPYYMSPEQAQGQVADARSDLYSLGCVLFEMLTGHTPFEKNSTAETLNAHVRETAPSLRSVAKISHSALRDLERIVAKMLEKNPARRFQCAKDLREEFEILEERLHREEELSSSVQLSMSLCSSVFRNKSSSVQTQGSPLSGEPIKKTPLSKEVVSKPNGVFEIHKVSAASENSSVALSTVFKPTGSPGRRQDFTMILLVVALAFISASAMIMLEPVFLPVSARAASAPIVNPLSVFDKPSTSLSDNPSDLVKRTFGATVKGKFHVSERDLWALPALTDSDLPKIKEFPSVRDVNLITAQSVTGEGLHAIKMLPIESLDLRSLTISQAGFDAISEMKKLKTLRIDYMPFLTVQKLTSLRSAPTLEVLTCCGTHLSFRCQSEIAKMPHLRKLAVAEGVGLTDSSLELFASMPSLEALTIEKTTTVSDEAIQEFKKVRPDVKLELQAMSSALEMRR